MQTFLPYSSFEQTATVLDYRRLGKQRVEARQILDTILNNKKGAWSNHPAVHMWRGYTDALSEYSDCMIMEWIKRGYKNNMVILNIHAKVYPEWLGDNDFHVAHRSNLIRKDASYYEKIWPDVPGDLPYVWPGRPDLYVPLNTKKVENKREKPSDFLMRPYGSIVDDYDAETVARNIMRILEITGNEWRDLSLEEYTLHRMDDQYFEEKESYYFNKVSQFCKSSEVAKCFSREWNR